MTRPTARRPPSSLRRHLVANFVGRGWTGVSLFACTPAYLHFLGAEAYGLIGFFLTVLAVANLVDLGLSASINRQLARLSGDPGRGQEIRDLVRSLEVVYWALAVILGTAVILFAPTLAAGWLRPDELPVATIENGVVFMGVALAFQWPLSLYSGGLMGLQRQVSLNVVVVVMMTVRVLGAVLVLWLVSPTVTAFFLWQAFAGLAHTLTTAALLWRSLPAGRSGRFRRSLLLEIWRFAAGAGATSALAVVITQMDKVLLSHVLTLTEFGYYSLASLVASGMTYLIAPIFQAVFPHFTHLLAREGEPSLRTPYHRACQLMSGVVLPAAAVSTLYSSEILRVWTGDPVVVEESSTLVTMLVVGTALNGLMNVPYALQLAHGWTSLALSLNVAAVVVFLPLLTITTERYGAEGAAAIWICINAGYLVFGVNVMHRRVLRGEKLRWLWQDVAVPLAAAGLAVMIARAVVPLPVSRIGTGALLIVVFGLAVLVCALVMPTTRAILLPSSWRGAAVR